MKVSRIVSYYNNSVPKKLSEQEFYQSKNSLPIYPKPKDPIIEVLKENWGYLFFLLFPPLIFLFLVNGVPESINNHYSAIAKQNNIIKAFYDAIYSSSNYFEYCAKYEKIKYKLNM